MLPEGWAERIAPSLAEEITPALTALHQRFRAVTEERTADYALRTLECAECRAARLAAVPPTST